MSAETGDFCPECGTWLEGVVIDHEGEDGELCSFDPDDPEWVGWLEDQVSCAVCGEGDRPGEPLDPGDGMVGVHAGCEDCDLCGEVLGGSPWVDYTEEGIKAHVACHARETKRQSVLDVFARLAEVYERRPLAADDPDPEGPD